MTGKLQYHSRLYLSESISDSKLDKIKKRLNTKPLLSNVYLITISQNPRDQLDILAANQLVQKFYSKHPVYVIGIASDYDEAVALIKTIVQECLKTRGDCALKEYLLC